MKSFLEMKHEFKPLSHRACASAVGIGYDLCEIGECRLLNHRLPESWGDFPYLTEVTVSGSGIQGSLPEAWARLPAIKRIDLSDNALTGTLPEEWSQLRSLR